MPGGLTGLLSLLRRRAVEVQPAHAHWWIVAPLALGLTTAGVNVTAVNLALPKIMTSLRADLDIMQWVQISYVIAGTLLIPSVDWVGSHLGNRTLYLLAIGLLLCGSVLCSLSWNIYALIAFRAIQGMGAGWLYPLTRALLFQIFPETQRGLAMGIYTLGFSFGPTMGPILSGYVLEHTSWHMIFYLSVPTATLSLMLAYLVLPQQQELPSRRLDIVGMLSLVGFVVAFSIAMSQGRSQNWNSSYIRTLLTIALIAGLIFVVAELRTREPFVVLRLYNNRAFAVPAAVMLIDETCYVATLFTTVFFLQTQLGYTPLQAAQMLIPAAIVSGIMGVLSGRLSDRIPARVLIAVGFGMYAWVMFQYATIDAWTSRGWITFWLAMREVAHGFTAAPLAATSLAPLSMTETRMGSGLLSLNRGIAGSCGVALAAAVLQYRLAAHVRLLDQNPGLHSYHDVYSLIGCIFAACILPVLWLGKHRREAMQ